MFLTIFCCKKIYKDFLNIFIMFVWIYAVLSAFIISLIGLIGILLVPIKLEKLKKVLIYFVSFSTGALLGVAFFHLLPEVVKEIGLTFFVSSLILGGILLFFLLEKIIHWHYNLGQAEKEHKHTLTAMILIGGSFHNFLDGLIIGASYLISIPMGIAITTAIALHKISKEIGWFGVLVHGGFSKFKAIKFNYFSSLFTIIGTIIALIWGNYVSNIQFFIIPVAIGGFIYIAGSNLIPELHKENDLRKSILQFLIMLSGMVVMALLVLIK